MREQIEIFLNKHNIAYKKDADMSSLTWIHRGGVANFWITPNSITQLHSLCDYLNSASIQYKVIGHSSNLYFKNCSNPDIIISTRKLDKFYIEQDSIHCECGAAVKQIAKCAIEEGFIGYEGLVDLPGTIAAAVCNNSSCYGCSVADILISADFLLPDGNIIVLFKDDLAYTDRSSSIKRKDVSGTILSVRLRAKISNNKQQLQQQAIANHNDRVQNQEKPAHTLGSIFPLSIYQKFENNLPFSTKSVIFVLRVLRYFHLLTRYQYSSLKNDAILATNGLWKIRKYISKYTFNCFIWKDANADEAFEIYHDFVKTIVKDSTTEIEIIQ